MVTSSMGNEERIRQKIAPQSEKQVFLRGDRGVLFGDLMDIFDRLQRAGVSKIGVVTKGPEDR